MDPQTAIRSIMKNEMSLEIMKDKQEAFRQKTDKLIDPDI